VFYRRLFENFDDALVLYLALLLHYTGKAVGARPHAEASAVFAQRVATRLQLSSEQRKSLILLVDHHLTLSNIAQQRNLDDPASIAELANTVKDQKNLDALMLVTLADGQGTSAEAWSDWKESLVWQLYDATSQYLADQKSYYEQTRIERDLLKIAVAQSLPVAYAEEIDAHFEFMPESYFRAFTPDEIVHHLKLLHAFVENVSTRGEQPLVPVIGWQAFPDQGHTVSTICTWEREQLLAKIAGSFAVAPLNILSADVFPRGDHITLNVFRVCDTNGRAVSDQHELHRVEKVLRTALEHEQFEFAPLIEKTRRETRRRLFPQIDFPSRIAIDNKAHPSYTLIQIQTPDRLGLLYDLLTCFDGEAVSIALSRISTQNGAAIDTFYVADRSSHGKITDTQRVGALQERLKAAALGGTSS
jgi:[protein-PII] uridylyltransferase